jgi:hypothetical protein
MAAPMKQIFPGAVVRLKHSHRLVTVESLMPDLGVASCYWYENNRRESAMVRVADIELLTDSTNASSDA